MGQRLGGDSIDRNLPSRSDGQWRTASRSLRVAEQELGRPAERKIRLNAGDHRSAEPAKPREQARFNPGSVCKAVPELGPGAENVK